MDGAAIINMLKPTYGKTFRDYPINTIAPYIPNLLRQVERMDLVCDRYFAENWKNYTREKHGTGVRRKITGNCLLPTNCMTFLRCSKNKAELFPYLSNVVVKEIQDKVVVSTVNEDLVTNVVCLEISPLMPCNMQEVDEMTFAYEKHASREHTPIMVQTADSNIVVIAIANFHQLVPLK